MRKIILLCAAGMSTSLLVNKMKEYAKKVDYSVEIAAYPIAQAEEKGSDADIILLGPQVRFNLDKVKKLCPNQPVLAIDMNAYGMMNGEKVIRQVQEVLGD